MIAYASLNFLAFAYSLNTISGGAPLAMLTVGTFFVVGVIIGVMFFGFFSEMLNPEVSGMEIRIVYDKIEKNVPQNEIYDRTTKIKNLKRICSFNPIRWILPI